VERTLCFSQNCVDHRISPNVFAVTSLVLSMWLAISSDAHLSSGVFFSLTALKLLPRCFSARS
jgi:hypothetical protein